MKKLLALLTVLALMLSLFPLTAFATDNSTQTIVSEATPRAGAYYKTNCACNLRANAGTNYASYCTLSQGQTVLYHSSKTSGNYTWYYVSVVGGTYAGYYGYIRSDLLTYSYWG